jgi:MFS family permease
MPFVLMLLIIFLFACSLMAVFVIYASFLQQAHSPVQAAWLLFPLPLTAMMVSLSLARLKRHSPVLMSSLGLFALALGLLGFSMLLTLAPPSWELIMIDVLLGLGMGCCFGSLNAIGLLHVREECMGVASSVLTLAQQGGYTVGVALFLWLLGSSGGVYSLVSYQEIWRMAALGMTLALLLMLVRVVFQKKGKTDEKTVALIDN